MRNKSRFPQAVILQIRYLLFFVVFYVAICQASVLDQKPLGAINDFASKLSLPTKDSLEMLSKRLLEKSGVSLVLVTTPTLDGQEISDVATRLFEKWGIGKKGVDEGVLLLISVADRQVRIETGYGSEAYLTDVESSRIIRQILAPFLAKQSWDEGCSAACLTIAYLAAKAHAVSLAEITGKENNEIPAVTPYKKPKINMATLVILGVLLLFLLSTRGGRSILFLLILSSLSSGSSRGGSGGFGGGFGSGGFGGFGGGSSGGGGASGRF